MRGRCAFAAMGVIFLLSVSQAGAQQPIHRIGVLMQAEFPEQPEIWPQALREHGWVIGQNIQIENRYFYDHPERVPALATELAALGSEIIVASGPPAIAVRAAAPKIPLVFVGVADPIGLGLVDSLAHPGGNATGITTTVPEGFIGKGIQLLKDLVPKASRIAVLMNPRNPMHQRELPKLPEIGRLLGLTLLIVESTGPDQLVPAFDAAIEQGAEAMDVWGDPNTFLHASEIVALAARYRLPSLYLFRQSVVDGGLLAFGADLVDSWRRAADYVDKILRGARPADLPVWQPTGYQLTVNLKTAASLGITIPPLILAEATEVIE